MKLAFILFHYFPHGGLQRDFYRIAHTCQQQGHEIHVFCMQWVGEKPQWLNLHPVKTKGWTNHTRCRNFAIIALQEIQSQGFNRIVGFNKMAGLDIYYAADGCFANKNSLKRNPLLKFLPRYKTFLKMERAVFSIQSNCKILSISPKEKSVYQKIYHTQEERFIALPPGISQDKVPNENTEVIRKQYRDYFQIKDNEYVLISIGSSYHTKGIDRTIQAIAELPSYLKKQCHYFIVGKENNIQKYEQLAQKHGINSHFLGARDDIPALLWMSDMLIHVARTENTGTAIVESIVAHIPVITTENCGYAFYVQEAHAGMVLPEPFQSKKLTRAIIDLLTQEKLTLLRQNASNYANSHDLSSMITQAANFICTL